MRARNKPVARLTLADQLSATLDDALADLASAMDEMDEANQREEAGGSVPPVEPLEFMLDDIDRAIDAVLGERNATLSSG